MLIIAECVRVLKYVHTSDINDVGAQNGGDDAEDDNGGEMATRARALR